MSEVPDRFSEVIKGLLFRGGKPSPKELALFKKAGIKKIISLDEESGRDIQPICRELGLDQIIWGLGDGTDPKVAALKKRIVPTLLHDGPTYIHCYHGKDRTGMAVAMFRVFSGWSLEKALSEAYDFGMGSGLSRNVRHSYYDAVKEFYKELLNDRNNSIDAVTLTRQTNPFGSVCPGIGDSTIPNQLRIGIPPHADIEFSQLSRIAGGRIYCYCKSSNLLKPKVFWWGSSAAAKNNPTDSDGKLFSAVLSSDTRIERFDKQITPNLIHHILSRDIDVAALRNEQYLILYPGSLINIHEEDLDVNDMFMPEVGRRDNSTDYTFAYPGSGSGVGGMPDGAAGIVQLPYSGGGFV